MLTVCALIADTFKKHQHPEQQITKQAMAILNSFVGHILERISTKAGNLVKITKKKTLTSRDMDSACKLILPGQLTKRAIYRGANAVRNFIIS